MFSRLHVGLLFHCVLMGQTGELTNYTLTFNTCNTTYAGTEDDVVIVLCGSKGANITQRLNGAAGVFGRGSSYSLEIQDTNVGHVCNLSVYRGKERKEGWKLKSLSVRYHDDMAVFPVVYCPEQTEFVDRGVAQSVYQRTDIENFTSAWTSWNDCDCMTGLRHRRRYNLCTKDEVVFDKETCSSSQTADTMTSFSGSNIFNTVLAVSAGVLFLTQVVVCVYFQSKCGKPASENQTEEPNQSAVREGYEMVLLPAEKRDCCL